MSDPFSFKMDEQGFYDSDVEYENRQAKEKGGARPPF
jgi:hypothetical protein